MEPISFWERLSKLANIILKSPFFIALAVIFILTIVVLIINAKARNKIVRGITALGYACIVAFIFIEYGGSVISLSDSLFDNIFTTIYFPNLISYICMMIAATLLVIRTMVNNKVAMVVKISNFSAFVIILFLFILSLDVIVKNNIDVYSKQAVYANESLTILIQSSMGAFAIWIILIGIDQIIKYFIKRSEIKEEKIGRTGQIPINLLEVGNNKKKIPYIEPIDHLDEPVFITEDVFYKSLNNYKKKKRFKDYFNIFDANK